MEYGVSHRLDYCDFFGVKKRVDLLKRGYSGAITPIIGGAIPLTRESKNIDDDKFNEVNTGSVTVRVIANTLTNLNIFYTDDEREWQIKLYEGEDIGGYWDDTRKWDDIIPWDAISNQAALKWSGFLIPDGSRETFSSYPYEFELTATDLLGTLKDVPFMKDKVVIRENMSIKDVLILALSKTDLKLDTVISVNTFDTRMSSVSDLDCPLDQAIIDTNRFIDSNGVAFSCLEVISALCRQFTANCMQENGAWYFIDVSQKDASSYLGRRYDTSGVKMGTVGIGEIKIVSADQIVNHDHTMEMEPAYKVVTNYYQYGYLSNKIPNGDFNLINPDGTFKNWTPVGGIVVGVGRKYIKVPGQEDNPISDWYAIINNEYNNNTTKWLVSDSLPVKVTQRVGVSASVAMENPYGQPMDHGQVTFKLSLKSAGLPTYFWSGFAWVTGSEPVVQIDINPDDAWAGSYGEKAGASVNFSTSNPPYEGELQIHISGVQARPGFRPIKSYFDNVSISLDENQYYRSPIGTVTQLTQIGNYSKSLEAKVLMFGDDSNPNRTSFLRLADGTHTELWKKKGTTDTPASLQSILAKNVMTQYQRPSNRFEGSFLGDFTPLDTLSIPLTGGQFRFMSGSFDLKSCISKLVLTEVFPPFDKYSTSVYQDTGDYKDSSGSSIGSTSGVSVPPAAGASTNENIVFKSDIAAGKTIGANTSGNSATADVALYSAESGHSLNTDKVAGYVPYNPANNPVQSGGETLQSITNRGSVTTKPIQVKSIIMIDSVTSDKMEITLQNGVLVATSI